MEKKVLVFLVLSILLVGCKEKPKEGSEQNDKAATLEKLTRTTTELGDVSNLVPPSTNTEVLMERKIKKETFNLKGEHIGYIEKELVPKAQEILKDCAIFKPLSAKDFRKQMKRVFGIDIEAYKDDYFPLSYDFMPFIICKKECIIIDKANILEKTGEYLCLYNRLFSYEDPKIINYFKKEYPSVLISLVTTHGFYKNKEIFSFALANIDYYSSEGKEQVDSMIFDILPKTEEDKFKKAEEQDVLFVLRRVLFDKLFDYTKGDFPIETRIDDMILNPHKYKQPKEDLAYMMNSAIDRELPKWSFPESMYDRFPEYISIMKAANYYGYEKLKVYTEVQYGKMPKDEKYPKIKYEKAVINDPDGYTNVRDREGKIVFKIKEGEEFMVSKGGKNIIGDSYKEGWWYVRFRSQGGYIHSSRVKIVK